MRLRVGEVLPMMLANLSPEERARAVAGVVSMLQGAQQLLETDPDSVALGDFRDDAIAANALAKATILNLGLDQSLAHQVKLS